MMLLAVKYEPVTRKKLLQSLNTGFQIIRAEYNFVFPGNMLNNRLLLVETNELEP